MDKRLDHVKMSDIRGMCLHDEITFPWEKVGSVRVMAWRAGRETGKKYSVKNNSVYCGAVPQSHKEFRVAERDIDMACDLARSGLKDGSYEAVTILVKPSSRRG